MRPPNFGKGDDKRIRFVDPNAAKMGSSQPKVPAPYGGSQSDLDRSPAPAEERPTGAAQYARTGPIRIKDNLVDLAQEDDRDALHAIFGQFIPADETILWAGFLGKFGLLFGRKSFACLTDKRVADISIGWFGEIIYQDALLEYFNSTVVYQPSRLALYILCIATTIFYGIAFMGYTENREFGSFTYLVLIVLAAGFLLLTFEFIVRLYYRLVKCGIVLWIKDGVSIYMFADRKLLPKANALLRLLRAQRDERIASLGHIG